MISFIHFLKRLIRHHELCPVPDTLLPTLSHLG